ncbi:DUF1648 domain-containing protein [Oceanithermus sp.]
MKPQTEAVLILLGAVALVWLVVLPFYLALPDLVPAHLNAAGEVNRWGSKLEALALPLIFTFVLLATLPILLVAPIEWSEATVRGLAVFAAVGAFFALLQPLGLYLTAGDGPAFARLLDAGIGLLIATIGLGLPALVRTAPPQPICGFPSSAPVPDLETRVKGARIGGRAIAAHGGVVVLLALFGVASAWITAYLVGGLVVLGVFLCVYLKRTLEPRLPR